MRGEAMKERSAALNEIIRLCHEITKLKAERDAEFVRGLLRANEMATKFWADCADFDRAIQAEIDKASK